METKKDYNCKTSVEEYFINQNKKVKKVVIDSMINALEKDIEANKKVKKIKEIMDKAEFLL